MLVDLAFAHRYSVDPDVSLPSGGDRRPVYYYPGASRLSGKDGVLIEITPADGPSWIGMFAAGDWSGPTGIYSSPDERSLCVLCGGDGYIVRADDPQIWEEIYSPILEIRVAPEVDLLIFRTLDSLFAYGKKGFAWHTERIALDGLTIEAVEGYTLRGMATVPGYTVAWSEQWVNYSVDLRTGTHQGSWE